MKKTNILFDAAAIIFCSLFVLAGSLINIHRFWQFDLGYYDFGIVDHAIWRVAHFQAPIIDHFRVSGKWIWADHFNPSIFLFSPIYWFTDLAVGSVLTLAFFKKILMKKWLNIIQITFSLTFGRSKISTTI